MKHRIHLILAGLALAGTAYAGIFSGPAVTWTTARTSGQEVSIRVRDLDDHTREVTVYSKGSLTEKQLLDLLAWKAATFADGRAHEKMAKVEPWEYAFQIKAEDAGVFRPGLKATAIVEWD